MKNTFYSTFKKYISCVNSQKQLKKNHGTETPCSGSGFSSPAEFKGWLQWAVFHISSALFSILLSIYRSFRKRWEDNVHRIDSTMQVTTSTMSSSFNHQLSQQQPVSNAWAKTGKSKELRKYTKELASFIAIPNTKGIRPQKMHSSHTQPRTVWQAAQL